jgi:glycopeptide antibiotics resistance protein
LSLTYRLDWIRERTMPAGPRAPTAAHFRRLALGVSILIVYGSLIPLRYRPMPFDEALAAFRRISYSDPSLLGARGDWVISIIQFAVPSFLSMAALCVDRPRALGLAAAALVLPGCIVLSVALEFLQLYFPPRTVSLNDIAVESLGGVAGALLWLLAGQRLTDLTRRFWNARGLCGLATQSLPAYLALLLIVQLMPFDLTVGMDEVAQKYREGKICLLPFGEMATGGIKPFARALTNAACFFPLGVLMALVPKWAGWNWPAVLGLGLGITGLIESLQLFVYSRYGNATDVVTGTAAILLGWRLARAFRDRRILGPAWAPRLLVIGQGVRGTVAWMLLFFGWLGALALISWQPFDFTTDPARFTTADSLLTDEDTAIYGLRRMAWAPLADYYWGSKYNAFDQFIQKSLSFVPFGILMALTLRGGTRPGAGPLVVLVALIVGLGIEVGQYFVPSRHPSTSDLLIESFGAWLGLAAARHVGAALRVEVAPSRRVHEFCR